MNKNFQLMLRKIIFKTRNWFVSFLEYRKRKQTLEIIKKAKQAYLDNRSDYMCACFVLVEGSFLCYYDIVQRIPEFRKSTFGLYESGAVWWDKTDRESRIKAFDKLIEIYSK